MTNTYTRPNLIEISTTFKNSAGAVADPTTVTGAFEDGSGTVTTYFYGTDVELVKDSTGVYHYNISLAANGDTEIYHYRLFGEGAVVGSVQDFFVVLAAKPTAASA